MAEVPLIQLLDRETGLMTKHTMHTHTNTHTHHAHTNTHTHTHTEGEGALLSVSLSPAGVHGWLSIVHSPAWSPTVGVVRAENQEVDKAIHCLGGLEVSLTFASNHHRELVLQQVQWGRGRGRVELASRCFMYFLIGTCWRVVPQGGGVGWARVCAVAPLHQPGAGE